jgi:hypothetical protein
MKVKEHYQVTTQDCDVIANLSELLAMTVFSGMIHRLRMNFA